MKHLLLMLMLFILTVPLDCQSVDVDVGQSTPFINNAAYYIGGDMNKLDVYRTKSIHIHTGYTKLPQTYVNNQEVYITNIRVMDNTVSPCCNDVAVRNKASPASSNYYNYNNKEYTNYVSKKELINYMWCKSYLRK